MTEIPQTLIDELKAARAQADHYLGIERRIRTKIEDLLDDEEYATVGGKRVVRWAHIKIRRLDKDKLRGNVDPAVLASCYVDGMYRRFIVLGDD